MKSKGAVNHLRRCGEPSETLRDARQSSGCASNFASAHFRQMCLFCVAMTAWQLQLVFGETLACFSRAGEGTKCGCLTWRACWLVKLLREAADPFKLIMELHRWSSFPSLTRATGQLDEIEPTRPSYLPRQTGSFRDLHPVSYIK